MSAQDQDTQAQDRALAAKGRMVSLVIVGTMVLWLLALWLGPKLGMPGRYAFLFDFAALAGLFWALVVSLQIRRARKDARGPE
ncbi:hypothetical protein So717_03140 [Roseobacter cerasinus]|uniref:DUF5337 domain-containing protein n=1 Tax=Roseobacter cerasinus TaxID=2602289 RepID=A0A640VN95_9RHOB|nr:DUF5337 domain-containing protein [Roseobacter cerasinus]GFE48561.1 hypothetical protein So717_03140 [Roseobacter cerasinus]